MRKETEDAIRWLTQGMGSSQVAPITNHVFAAIKRMKFEGVPMDEAIDKLHAGEFRTYQLAFAATNYRKLALEQTGGDNFFDNYTGRELADYLVKQVYIQF